MERSIEEYELWHDTYYQATLDGEDAPAAIAIADQAVRIKIAASGRDLWVCLPDHSPDRKVARFKLMDDGGAKMTTDLTWDFTSRATVEVVEIWDAEEGGMLLGSGLLNRVYHVERADSITLSEFTFRLE